MCCSWRSRSSKKLPASAPSASAERNACSSVRARTVGARCEELDGVGDDLDALALAAVLGLPLAPLEAPVDRDRPALGQVARAVFAQRAPDRHVEVVGPVVPLAAAAVLPARVAGDAQRADRRAGAGGAQLGVAREVAGEHDAV